MRPILSTPTRSRADSDKTGRLGYPGVARHRSLTHRFPWRAPWRINLAQDDTCTIRCLGSVSAKTPAVIAKKKVAKIAKQKPAHGSKRYTEAERNVILGKKKAGVPLSTLK